ncbi:MAG: sigma-70 family RNA polymerase sigma factor [Clostridia bacterium]|nr:sigma-70 family RNA polymerase sigma factor [Clostridia bacterium]
MDISKDIIEKYAKKIYGFAFSKTRDYNDAQDLSQEILLVLFDKGTKLSQIENMGAYIYRICCYTWMNFYRKDIQKRKNLENASVLEFVADETDIEEEYIKKELHEKLRQEIMYLSKMKREVTIMFYYENKTSKEISEILNIPDSSVRWYLGESKKTLKERIEMTEQGIYKPVKIGIGHNGWTTDYDMFGLRSDVLMQNICYLCYQKPHTIEEIARTLGVAAVYLEDKIDKLLHMDYLKPIGKNKYQTTFFIMEDGFYLESKKFMYKFADKISVPLYNLTVTAKDELKKSGSLLGEYNDNFLMWSLLMLTINNAVHYINELVSKKKGLNYIYPKRKDGSEHFVSASMVTGEIVDNAEKDFKEFFLKCEGCGVKTRTSDKLNSLQYDIGFFGQGWRDFDDIELNQLSRVVDIIEKDEIPNEYDKHAIANLVKKGYVRVENEKPIILIPYLKHQEHPILFKYYDKEQFFEKIKKELDIDEVINMCCEHIDNVRKLIPSFLDETETNQILCNSFTNQYSFLWSLWKKGYLQTPSAEEIKRLCTFVNEK